MVDAIATTADFTATDVVVAYPKKVSKKKKTVAKTVVAKDSKPKISSARREFSYKMMRYLGHAMVGCVCILLAISLPHIALGISILTGNTAFGGVAHISYQDYTFATTFDLMMGVVELSLITAIDTKVTAPLFKYGPWFVAIANICSAAMNSIAFAQHASGLWVYTSIVFGVIVTGGMFFMIKMASSLYMATGTRN